MQLEGGGGGAGLTLLYKYSGSERAQCHFDAVLPEGARVLTLQVINSILVVKTIQQGLKKKRRSGCGQWV